MIAGTDVAETFYSPAEYPEILCLMLKPYKPLKFRLNLLFQLLQGMLLRSF